MKKYVILSKIGMFHASEERQFNNLDDARAFRNLLNDSKTNEVTEYYIAEVIELLYLGHGIKMISGPSLT